MLARREARGAVGRDDEHDALSLGDARAIVPAVSSASSSGCACTNTSVARAVAMRDSLSEPREPTKITTCGR